MASLVISSLATLFIGGLLVGFALWLKNIADEKEKEERKLEVFKDAS